MEITYLIPVFNEIKTVKESIIQAIKIPIKNKEIIVIDNNSTDGSAEVVKRFLKFANIKLILRKKNMGYGPTLYEGTKIARGKYIYIHYSDLEYDIKTSIEMLRIAKKKNLDAVFASRLIKKLKNKNIISIIIERPYYLASFILTTLINILFKKNFTDIIGTKLYKKKSVINILPNKNNISFDLELDAILCKKQFKTDEVFIKYNPRKNSKEKKVKWWYIFNFIIGILNTRFINKF
jgi:glycosyltransferase involved in cell wall biosynthesis